MTFGGSADGKIQVRLNMNILYARMHTKEYEKSILTFDTWFIKVALRSITHSTR